MSLRKRGAVNVLGERWRMRWPGWIVRTRAEMGDMIAWQSR